MTEVKQILKLVDDEIAKHNESMIKPDITNYLKKQISIQSTTLTRMRHQIHQLLSQSPFLKDENIMIDQERPTKYRTVMTKYRGGAFSIANQYYHEYLEKWKVIDNDCMSISIHTPKQINNFIKVFNDTDKNNLGVEIILDEWIIGANNKIKGGKNK